MLQNKILTTITFLSLLVSTSCKKEDTKDVSTTLRVPVLELQGEHRDRLRAVLSQIGYRVKG